jgi:hypothetical protein
MSWCGGWDSNPRRPTPQDFSCEPDLKSSPVRSCERSCPFDLNPATIGRGPVHGLGNPRIQHSARLLEALNDNSHQRVICRKLSTRKGGVAGGPLEMGLLDPELRDSDAGQREHESY